jgi:hypothetical protein
VSWETIHCTSIRELTFLVESAARLALFDRFPRTVQTNALQSSCFPIWIFPRAAFRDAHPFSSGCAEHLSRPQKSARLRGISFADPRSGSIEAGIALCGFTQAARSWSAKTTSAATRGRHRSIPQQEALGL